MILCPSPMTSSGRKDTFTDLLITLRHLFRSFDALNDIIFPSLYLTTPSSAAIRGSLQDSLWETRRPRDMAIPLKLPYFESCKQFCVWANCMLDPVGYILIGDGLCIRYVQCSVFSPQNCQFHHRPLESLEHLNAFFIIRIYHS